MYSPVKENVFLLHLQCGAEFGVWMGRESGPCQTKNEDVCSWKVVSQQR